ncbi:MAG: RHS repeat-associated core domain-containing protein [Pirellulaceae bacterium]
MSPFAFHVERVTDALTNTETKRVVYTLGHDLIAQTTYTPSGPAQGETLVLHYDGHGSTRILTNLLAAVATIGGQRQLFFYDAYGNALGFNPTLAATTHLYSGEQFDSRINQQYLRARWYDASTGRFGSLDPFIGNNDDPQSLHKYLYTHADPINGIDPSGLFFVGSIASVGIRLASFALPGPSDFIIGALQSLVQAYAVNLQWDLEWAFDFSMPDDWGSHSSNEWVTAALLGGIHDAYWIGIPFTNIGFNPLDWLMYEQGLGGISYDEWVNGSFGQSNLG